MLPCLCLKVATVLMGCHLESCLVLQLGDALTNPADCEICLSFTFSARRTLKPFNWVLKEAKSKCVTKEAEKSN